MEEYFFVDSNNERRGPVARENLLAHGVNRQTMVWKKGMANWQVAGVVPELASLFTDPTGNVPPLSPSSNPTMGPITTQPPFKKPDNNLVWAILATVFCCLPFGVVAIIFSSKVDSAWNIGDYIGAQEAAKKAATFCWISAGVSLFFWLMYLIFAVVIGLNAI